jgi:hypothetical protein
MAMSAAHEPREHCRIAHPRIEDSQCGRSRMQLREFVADSARNDRLFIATRNEGEIFLAVVVKPKWRRRKGAVGSHCCIESNYAPVEIHTISMKCGSTVSKARSTARESHARYAGKRRTASPILICKLTAKDFAARVI